MIDLNELFKSLEGKNFNSIEEANQFLKVKAEEYNNMPLDQFCGLSPHQMNDVLYSPFDSPQIVTFNMDITPPMDAPFIRIFWLIIKEFEGKNSLRATVPKGNLPLHSCRNIISQYLKGDNILEHEKYFASTSIRSERDFYTLHCGRVVSELAGYIKKRKKRYTLTKRGENILKNGFSMDDYLHLLKIYALKFNWPYTDLYPEVPIVQHAFLFTLYLFHIFGDEERQIEFYAQKFLEAFPMAVEECMADPVIYKTPKEMAESIYMSRTIEKFAYKFGLVEIKEEIISKMPFKKKTTVKRTKFFEDFLQFYVPNKREIEYSLA